MDDGWSALHLACKTSNEIFMLLIDLGADVSLQNKKKMTLMHKAAYDDNTYLITYLRDKHNFEVQHTDINGNSPLHFACSEGAEYATFWLIGFGSNVNAPNKDGDTPLHLLMKNSDKLGGTKSVKELIFKGADKELKNNWDMKPAEYLDQVKNSALQSELDSILGIQPCYLSCMQLGQPMMKIDRSNKTMFTFVAIMITSQVMIQLFVL